MAKVVFGFRTAKSAKAWAAKVRRGKTRVAPAPPGCKLTAKVQRMRDRARVALGLKWGVAVGTNCR